MFTKSELGKSLARIKKESRLDETGRVHPFYAYSIPTTEEAIIALAATIDAPKKARDENVRFFKDKENLVHVVERDRIHFGGREKIPAMEAALFGMSQLQGFLFSEARTQSTPGPNRGGKTRARMQKLICIALGFDPLRPDYEFPFDASRGPIIIWSCVPAKNTGAELMDLSRLIPSGYKFRLYRAKGEERIEFDPTPLRPYGCIIRIKSYSMPVDQFQREAVHVISMDERCYEHIWVECRMRLVSTSGWMILAMALYDLEVWLYEKNRKFAPELRGLKDGDYAWYSWYQTNCPWIPQSIAAAEWADGDDDEKSARYFGDPKLLVGDNYFKPREMIGDLWQRHCQKPKWACKFDRDGSPIYTPFEGRAGWRLWQRPERGCTYAIGADVALGKGGDNDYSAAHIFRTDTREIVGVFEDNTIESEDFGLELYFAGKAWNYAVVAIEVNVEGSSAHHWLKHHGYPRIYRSVSKTGKMDERQDAFGWRTTGNSKSWALDDLRRSLKAAHDGSPDSVIVYDGETYEQLADFGHLHERRKKSHGTGGLTGHDDLVMSLAITVQAATQAERTKRMNRVELERTEIEKWDAEDRRDSEIRKAQEAEDLLS